MAGRNNIPAMVISREEYVRLFGESGSEEEDEEDVDSDIDIDDVSSSDSEESDDEEEVPRVATGWTTNLTNTTVNDFTSPSGKTFDLPDNAKEVDVFNVLFDNNLIESIVRESNLYARQKLANSEERIAKFTEITGISKLRNKLLLSDKTKRNKTK